jgi:hypothetical protein
VRSVSCNRMYGENLDRTQPNLSSAGDHQPSRKVRTNASHYAAIRKSPGVNLISISSILVCISSPSQVSWYASRLRSQVSWFHVPPDHRINQPRRYNTLVQENADRAELKLLPERDHQPSRKVRANTSHHTVNRESP